MRLVLQLAQFHQVIYSFFFGLHVPVQHCRVRAQSDFMRLPRNVQPHLPAHFVVANDFAHARMKNLRPAAPKRIHTGFLQFQQHFFHAQLGNAREVAHFHHRERLQVHAGAALFQPAQHVQEVFKRQIGMQPAHDVKFQCALAHALFRARVNLFQRKAVRSRSVRVAPKRAQFAMRHANIRRIDVPVDVVIRHVAVLFLAHVIRQPAYGQ